MPPTPSWYCNIVITVLTSATSCSTFLLLTMTFERFYSIIRPHKAASFNTVKRAKITIVCIIITCITCNIPHLFMSEYIAGNCLPYIRATQSVPGKIHYWFNNVLFLATPFILLLLMNSIIIHTLCKRSKLNLNQVQGQSEGQKPKLKSNERQIIVMLLLVTFGFLVFVTPTYIMMFYTSYGNYLDSPKQFADVTLVIAVSSATYFTNFGINFYLYVLSGQKFRNDVVRLFKRMCHCGNSSNPDESFSNLSNNNTEISSVSKKILKE